MHAVVSSIYFASSLLFIHYSLEFHWKCSKRCIAYKLVARSRWNVTNDTSYVISTRISYIQTKTIWCQCTKRSNWQNICRIHFTLYLKSKSIWNSMRFYFLFISQMISSAFNALHFIIYNYQAHHFLPRARYF